MADFGRFLPLTALSLLEMLPHLHKAFDLSPHQVIRRLHKHKHTNTNRGALMASRTAKKKKERTRQEKTEEEGRGETLCPGCCSTRMSSKRCWLAFAMLPKVFWAKPRENKAKG